MSGAAAARGLRGAAANSEAEEFYRTLKGFLAARGELDEAARLFMPTNGAAAFDDVGGGAIRQHLGGAAADMDAQLSALFARAPAAKEALDGFCRRFVTDAGLDPDKEMIRETRDGEDKVLNVYSAGPLKGRMRAAEKAKNEYDGDAARLIDLVRGSIVCGDEPSLVAVLKRVLGYKAGDVCVVRSKNRFRNPLFNGYRFVLFNLRLRLPDGTSMVVELQVHLVQILEFKARTRVFYEFFQMYFCGNLKAVAERMKVLEAIDAGGDATAGLADAVERAVKARDASKLKALDDLLEKLAAFDLLAVVRECLCGMALAAHGADSVKHSFALNNLASLLEKQGAAEPLYRRALAIDEKRLGPDHPSVATSLDNLATLLQVQGKLDAAEPLYRRALAINEKQLVPDHPEVAALLNNLAGLLQLRGKLDAAEPLFRRALEIREKHLGPDHPDFAESLGNLALLLQAQCKLDPAKPLFRRAASIYEKQLGPDHPRVATSLRNLARLLKTQGNLDAAEPLYRRAIAIKEKQLGPEHPSVGISLSNLSHLLQAQGKLDAAEPLCRRALAIKENRLGLDHSDVATSINSLALLLWRLGRLDAALPLQERATAIKARLGDAKEAEYRGELDRMRRGSRYFSKK